MTQHSPDPAERLDESELRGLKTALRAMLGSEALVIDCQTQPLKGGTVGQVRLITDLAQTAAAGRLPFRLVEKSSGNGSAPAIPIPGGGSTTCTARG